MQNQISSIKQLVPDYYQQNFENVLNVVQKKSFHLFTEEEKERFKAYWTLSNDARKLYIRLFLRKGPLFRISRLVYPEIVSIKEASKELVLQNFASWVTKETEETPAGTIFSLFLQSELKKIARSLSLRMSGKKEDLVERLLTEKEALHSLLEKEALLSLQAMEVFFLVRVLFFGNRYQDFSEFIVVDLAHVRYPSYQISDELPIFADREALLEYLKISQLCEEGVRSLSSELLEENTEKCLTALYNWKLPAPHRKRVDAGRYWMRMAFMSARELERLGELEKALEIYEKLSGYALSTGFQSKIVDRLGLVAKRLGKPDQFLSPSQRIFSAESLDEISRFRLQKRRAILKLGPDPQQALLQAKSISLSLQHTGYKGPKALYQNTVGTSVSIEEAVLSSFGNQGVYAENTLYRTLFGLLCWEVIFAPIPGMFQHSFQRAPLDISSEDFFSTRKERFLSRFATLREKNLECEVEKAFLCYHKEANYFVDWYAYSLNTLQHCVKILGTSLLEIIERIAWNPKRHGRGLPDLLLWPEKKALLVEVKGPGDQVQIEQRLWHHFLLQRGIDVRIAHITRC